MNGFGNVKFCSRREVKEGYLLRETHTGIVFEKLTQNGTDVVAEFEGERISVSASFETCLGEARKYVGDKNTPIYVDLNPWDSAINQSE